MRATLLWLVASAGACGKVAATPDGATPPDAGPDAVDRTAAIHAAIDGAVLGPMHQPGAVGLLVGVIDGDDRVIIGYGVPATGAAQPPDATTLFEIGSNTKTLTATLLAAAVAANAVSLTDPLDQYMPAAYQFAAGDPKQAITLEQLADHTSGLPRNPTDVPADATAYTIDQLDADTDGLTPGPTTFVYSNLAYALLGDALAQQAGTTWAGLVQQVITQPLGMTDTAIYGGLGPAQLARVATGYAGNAIGTCTVPPCPVNPSIILLTFPAPAVNPAGGLYASGHDMMSWLAYNLGLAGSTTLDPLLPALRQPRVQWAPTKWVGLAWNTSPITLGTASHTEVWKDGDTNGFHSYVAYIPDAQRGVFVMANFPITTTPQALGDQILESLP
jgi:CubicO group peptidase (beta-lactamase class C family)